MAGRSTHRPAEPLTLENERAGYDRDFYSWSQEQGRLEKAARQAMNETGLKRAQFPLACPYSFEDIAGRAFDDE
jgi:hypothetical protein